LSYQEVRLRTTTEDEAFLVLKAAYKFLCGLRAAGY
jgi:hypothetical protein